MSCSNESHLVWDGLIMNLCRYLILTCVIVAARADFVFKDETVAGSTIFTFNFTATSCARNATVLRELRNLTRNYQKLTHFSAHELHLIDQRGFDRIISKLCEKRGALVADMSDKIRLMAKYCISDERQSKEVEMNSLLLLRTHLYFACEMSENQFLQIYEYNASGCFRRHRRKLDKCALSSYKQYFWETSPTQLPSVVDLVHGALC